MRFGLCFFCAESLIVIAGLFDDLCESDGVGGQMMDVEIPSEMSRAEANESAIVEALRKGEDTFASLFGPIFESVRQE